MFEYDQLAVDVAEQVLNSGNGHEETVPIVISSRRHFDPNLQSQHPGRGSSEAFECASSGYGSPGICSTPLPSPVPQDESRNNRCRLASCNGSTTGDMDLFDFEPMASAPLPFGPWFDFGHPSVTPFRRGSVPLYARGGGDTRRSSCPEKKWQADEDGFSNSEIEQFVSLLTSPRKQPPIKYQCHICYKYGHYINDCPMRFNSPYEELTPYQGRKKCYGEFQCAQCKRKWTSQNSVANEAQSCIKCHVPVFPHKQLPVDKAVALGLIKAEKPIQGKMSPIGHGRRPPRPF